MKKKIDYTNGAECLHLRYKDTLAMTKEDAVCILNESIEQYHNAKDEKHRINLPRPRTIRAYEIAVECIKNSMEKESKNINATEFAREVVEMIQSEKGTFKELIENENWDTLEDEIYEYVQMCGSLEH